MGNVPHASSFNEKLRYDAEDIMADLQVTLTTEERDFLVRFLDTALKDARIEEHRTRTPSYREHVLHREDLIAALLAKLGQPPK